MLQSLWTCLEDNSHQTKENRVSGIHKHKEMSPNSKRDYAKGPLSNAFGNATTAINQNTLPLNVTHPNAHRVVEHTVHPRLHESRRRPNLHPTRDTPYKPTGQHT